MTYLARNGSWLVLGQGAAAVISFGLAVAFGHFVSQDAYGNYKYVLAVAGVLGALSLSGLPTAVTQSVANGFDGALRQGTRLTLRYSFPLVAVAFALAGYEYWFAHNVFLAGSFILIGIFTPFLSSFSLFDAFLVGRKDFRRVTAYGTLDLLLPVLILLGSLFLTKRAIVFVAVYFVANTAAAAWFYARARRLSRNDTEDPDMLSYGAHLSVMNIIGTLADRIDSLAIFYFLGPAPLAVYSFAIAMPEQIKGLVKLLGPLSLPRFSERPWNEIRATIGRRLMVSSLLISVAILLYMLLAPLLFRVFFPLYVSAIPYSRIYALSIVLTGLVTPLVTSLQAHRKTKELYLATNSGSIILIVLTPILTSAFGILGAVASQMVYRAANAGFALWQFWSATDDPPEALRSR